MSSSRSISAALFAPLAVGASMAGAQPPEAADGAYTVREPVELYADGIGPGWAEFAGNLGFTDEGVMNADEDIIYNVSVPTYQAYLPDASLNTGTAVVVAPGGGFRILAMSHEGRQVAEWLAERGVAAFVLKYRLAQIDGAAALAASLGAMPIDEAGKPGVADGLRAIAMIRARAGDYAIDAARVGIVGFSAGAHVAAEAGLASDPAARPNFAAPIYGAPFGEMPPIPAADSASPLPPFFLAMAADDDIVEPALVLGFTQSLIDAGYTPELHLFEDGGHGFGMRRQGTTSDRWIDAFFWWMTAQGLTGEPGGPEHASED